MVNQEKSITEFLKLFRLQTGATTAVAPVIGYLVLAAQTGYIIAFNDILVLFAIGIFMHIFEFVLNEYIDVDVDRRSPDLTEKPLVKGSVTPTEALGVVIGSLVISYVLSLLFFFNLWSIIFLTLSFLFGAVYDIHGKRFAGSDFSLALWIFFFCLFGASIVTIQFTGVLYLIAGLGFFQILFNNAIEGGLKDADHDAAAGAHTLAYKLGVRVLDKQLLIPLSFRFGSFLIKLAHLFIIILLVNIGIIDIASTSGQVQFILIIIFIFIILFSLHSFLHQKTFRRDKLKRIFSVHEIATFYVVPILLLQLIGLTAVVGLLLLPLVWYMGLNLMLYGKPLEPRV